MCLPGLIRTELSVGTGTMETAASFEARFAPWSYPTARSLKSHQSTLARIVHRCLAQDHNLLVVFLHVELYELKCG